MDLQEMLIQAYPQSDEFYHHGVKGMKWGEHIFGRDRRESAARRRAEQKEKMTPKPSSSGSVEKKSSVDEAKARIKAAKAARKALKKQVKKDKKEEARKAKYLKDPKLLYKHRDEFTTDEIANAISRFKIEADLRSYNVRKVKDGKEVVSNIMGAIESGTKGYNNFAGIYNAIARHRGIDSRLPIVDIAKDKEEEKQRDRDNRG